MYHRCNFSGPHLKKTNLTVQRTNVNREYSVHERECLLAVGHSDLKLRVCSHGGGEPRVVEVPRLPFVKKKPILIWKKRSGLQWYPRSLSSVQTKMTNISKTKNAIFCSLKEVRSDHRSKFSNLSNWKEEAWKKKIRASTGFEPVTSAIPVRCSTNWATKPHIGSEVNSLNWPRSQCVASWLSW